MTDFLYLLVGQHRFTVEDGVNHVLLDLGLLAADLVEPRIALGGGDIGPGVAGKRRRLELNYIRIILWNNRNPAVLHIYSPRNALKEKLTGSLAMEATP